MAIFAAQHLWEISEQGLQLWRFRAKVAVLKGQGRQKFVAIRHAKSGDFGSLGGVAKLWRFWAKVAILSKNLAICRKVYTGKTFISIQLK